MKVTCECSLSTTLDLLVEIEMELVELQVLSRLLHRHREPFNSLLDRALEMLQRATLQLKSDSSDTEVSLPRHHFAGLYLCSHVLTSTSCTGTWRCSR